MTQEQNANTKKPNKVVSLPNPFGKYEVVRELGHGGMGCVYEARDTRLDRRVALKVPHAHLMTVDMAKRFEREARLAAQLDHPNICTVLECERIGDILYLAMAFVEGKSLAELSAQAVAPRAAAIVVRKCALAMAEAHRLGIIHRDIKPANIMINKRQEPIVMDFGLARAEGEETMTQAGTIMGTPAYMPLEQMERGYGEVGPHSDIYSLGAVLYQLLAGKPPFEGMPLQVFTQRINKELPPPSTQRAGINLELEKICLKAMAKFPRDRYVSMKEFAMALEQWLRQNANTSQAPVASTVDPPAETALYSPVPDAPAEPASPNPYALANPFENLPTQAMAPARIPSTPTTNGKHSPKPRWWWAIMGGVALLVLLIALGVIITVTTNEGIVEIVLSDPNAKVDIRLDGEVVHIHHLGKPIRVKPGKRELMVSGKDFETTTQRFTVVRGGIKVLRLALRPKYLGTRAGEERDFCDIKFCWIPAGTFTMGSPNEENNHQANENQVQVRLTRGFWLTKYQTTQEEYELVMGNNPSYFSALGGGKERTAGMDTRRFPVEGVSWTDAMEYCQKLTAQAHSRGELPPDWKYTLPTEAQWEYACRAGSTTPFHFGTKLNGKEANMNGNSPYGTAEKGPYLGRTCPVGSYPPNSWGLHDMHGNVWEWCLDYFKVELAGGVDPCVLEGGTGRILRGGSWRNYGEICRAASRNGLTPAYRHDSCGFRLVAVPAK